MSFPRGALSALKELVSRSPRSSIRSEAERVSLQLGSAVLATTRLDPAVPPDDLAFVPIGGRDEYEAYRRRTASVQRSRGALERLLAARQAKFGVVGYDACVGRLVEFQVDFDYATARDDDGLLLPNYRERLVSPATGLNCRQRATALVLKRLLAGRDPAHLSVYATEAVTPFFAWLRREYPGSTGSEYLGEAVPLGATLSAEGAPSGGPGRGTRNEDVTRLTFPDATFDAVVSCDVLEHVPDYGRALRELRRVLRQGGLLIATAPFRVDRQDHLIRARVSSSGTVEHLEPPEYHGDPVNPTGGVLCYQHFGWKLLDELREAGFGTPNALLVWSYYHGILGGDQIIFHAAV